MNISSQETIGQFEAAIYSISGLVLKRRVRSEHNLIRKELKKKAEQKAKSMTRKAGDIHDNKKENYDRNEDYSGVRKRVGIFSKIKRLVHIY